MHAEIPVADKYLTSNATCCFAYLSFNMPCALILVWIWLRGGLRRSIWYEFAGKLPLFYGSRLNLALMYRVVTKMGGCERVWFR
jgi:hypothetical protein